MKRLTVFAYGTACYGVSLLTLVYAAGFLGNLAVPKSIDSPRDGSLPEALLVDLALLTLFAIQHSVMARRGFKTRLTRWIPAAAERSTYLLASSLALFLLFWQWRPLGGVVWNIQVPLGRALLWTLYVSGLLLGLIATFMIDHLDLFGLRQVWLHLRGRPYRNVAFRTRGPYKLVRHPLYVGWLLTFWATPTMTVSHLVFALGTTAYILTAVGFEERDLLEVHGPAYEAYRRQVPMLVPRLRPRPTDRTLDSERASVLRSARSRSG